MNGLNKLLTMLGIVGLVLASGCFDDDDDNDPGPASGSIGAGSSPAWGAMGSAAALLGVVTLQRLRTEDDEEE